jgi:hypothetical protein
MSSRLQAFTMAFAALVAVPCLAGDLDEGVRFHERGDYAKAIGAFQRAAAKGEAEAQRRLGFMYYHGEGVRQDNARAVDWFEKAADGGDIQSAFNLGKMYEYGMGVAQDDGRAASWYTKAAEQGDRWAQFNASIMYYQGRGVPKDRVEAAKWWTIAMMKGGAFAETIRPSVESAEGKLTAEEVAEGKRRAAAWAQRSIVNLDKPGVLEAIEKRNPAHHRRIVEILRVAQAEPCETLPQILKTQFDAVGTKCSSYMLLTSDPPKRHLTFTLADTVYVTNVVQYKLRGKLTPAEARK